MEGTGIHQFDLEDARGVSHAYVVTEHSAGEGCKIFFQLVGLGAPTLLGLLGAAIKSEDLLGAVFAALGAESDDAAPKFDKRDLARMLADLDLASVGQEIGKALATGKAPELARAVLSNSYRDGQPLSKHFEIAYQANYMEMLQAIWKVCQYNRFFPEFSTSASLHLAKAETTPLPLAG